MGEATNENMRWWERPLTVAWLLTGVAGFVDAISFLLLGHIYTANMSGNSVSFGIGLGWVYADQILRRGVPVLAYVIGLIFCRLLVEFGARQKFRSIASVAFAIEILLLILTATNAGSALLPSLVFTSVLAITMGIQNGALTHFGNLTLHTGFVTGTLVKLAENLTKYVTWLWDHLQDRGVPPATTFRHSLRETCFRQTVWLALIWWAYAAGAAMGALAQMRFRFDSLLIAAAPLAGLIFVDIRHPLGLQDEKEELTI